MTPPDISVVICTFNRADSLRETLEHLAAADREGLTVEIVVVDNNSTDDTRNVVESFSDRIPVRYLFEPKQGFGKGDPLNRAVAEGGLGEIVAFLDDDMSPEKGWLQGVKTICDRYPDHVLFSGRSYVVWPRDEVPGWARDQQVLQWGMSVMDSIHEDRPIPPGFWPSGNHFWIRSKVFQDGRKFSNLWSEAHFTLGLLDDGGQGVYGPEATVGHRIQEPLLDPATMRKRAILCGRSRANSCLPYHRSVEKAKFLRARPILFRLYSLANGIRWRFRAWSARMRPFSDENFATELSALVETASHFESLRIAGRVEREWRESEKAVEGDSQSTHFG